MENTAANTINVADATGETKGNVDLTVFGPVVIALLKKFHLVKASYRDAAVIGVDAPFPLESVVKTVTDVLDGQSIKWNVNYYDKEGFVYRHAVIDCSGCWFAILPPTGHETDDSDKNTKVVFYNTKREISVNTLKFTEGC